MEEDRFSAREVATLVEDLRSEFKAVSQVVLPLREDMADVKERLGHVEDEVRQLKDTVRLGFPDIFKRLTRLEAKVGT